MDWRHGYLADRGYIYAYHPETMPVRLHLAALLHGFETPGRQFRYLDAGCGQGVNLILAAAAHPDSQFVGIDFMPDHIAHARALAAAAGLTNIAFIEGDFIDLAAHPDAHPALVEPFDFAIAHGISTWVAPEVRRALLRLVGRALRPGGLFYNSYNTLPGWLGILPLHHCLMLEHDQQSGAQAIENARRRLEEVRAVAPAMFQAYPGLAVRLDQMAGQNPSYLLGEYHNRHWQPIYFSQMFAEAGDAKLTYAGSATLTDGCDLFFEDGLRALLERQETVLLREQTRDLAVNQGFRRDLFVKGGLRPWPHRLPAAFDAINLIRNPLVARPAEGAPFALTPSAHAIQGEPATFHRLLDLIEGKSTPTPIGEVIAFTGGAAARAPAVQALALLIQGGWVLPMPADATAAAGRSLNRALATAVADGAPYGQISLPLAGTAAALGDAEWQMVRCVLDDLPPERWVDRITAGLERLGKPAAVPDAINRFRQWIVPFLMATGAV